MRILLVASMLLAGTAANAALFDRGDGMIYDSDRDLTWLSDMNAGGLFNSWGAAKSWADGLTHGGFTDWRLPSVYNSDGSTICMGFSCTDSELGNMYYNVFGAAAGGNINSATNTANRDLFSYPEGTNVFALNEEFNTGTAGSLDPFTCVMTPGLESCAFVFRNDGLQSYGSKGAGNIFYGWAVRNGDVTTVNPGVPEPASWAMMVIGFGLIGAIRRRRPAAVAA